MAVSGLIGRYNLARLRVDIDPPPEIYAGIETLATVELTNRKPYPSFLIVVELAGGQALFPIIPGRSTLRKSLPIKLMDRGRCRLPSGSFRSIFPVNFFIRSFPADIATEATIFPTPRSCRDTASPEGRKSLGDYVTPRRGSEGEVERIGDYRGGEPLKMIHWKLTARQDVLMVKEASDTSREPVVIEPQLLPGSGLEERLRCAAWLVNRYMRQNRPVGLQLPKQRIAPSTGTRHRLHMLTELALYGQNQVST
jgi:uncharacterized protein (DUF58 family)